jgi:hypothetical protein
MRLIPSDPDIRTIVNRIKDGDINLQPNFQRGEVWGELKKVKLIDSILRDWHVPPIHVVEIKESGQQDVLDGQQRLVAIRDFVNGKFAIDGRIEPFNNEIIKLDTLTYELLPDVWKRKFDKFTIRVYSITDYLPSEPGELFYRLNQPTNLTSAEQRNAFYGPAREQVKLIVEQFNILGLSKREIGFSNSRMAYDDVVARLCIYLDFGTLREKVTANILADKFRDEKGFSNLAIVRAKSSVVLFSDVVKYFGENIKFNKATLLSWLLFLTKFDDVSEIDKQTIGRFIYDFEFSRSFKGNNSNFNLSSNVSVLLLSIYSDRSSSRVADVSSVLIRDLIISAHFYSYNENMYLNHLLVENEEKLAEFLTYLNSNINIDIEDELYIFIENTRWGKVL